MEALLNASSIKPDSGLLKIMFVPDSTSGTVDQIRKVYSTLRGGSFETVVFIETRIMDVPKKIPMPTLSEFVTPTGTVLVDDALRNDFCDEDDDFFIDDAAYGPDMEIHRHLPYLQEVMHDFKVLSVPICDDDPAIVREVDYVLSELMGSRNQLIVVACSLSASHQDNNEFLSYVRDKDMSNIMNRINSGETPVSGSAAFMAGLLIAYSWDLTISFFKVEGPSESAIAGFGMIHSA
jgi:AmmeMemoRadiSam system protein B